MSRRCTSNAAVTRVCSWAENTRPLSPAFPPSSHRSSSPTDTDVDALAMTAGPDQQAPTATDTLVPGKEEDDSADMSSRKGSVYLDAISEGGDDISARGVGEMMRELREIPDPEPDLTEGNEQEQDHVGRLGLVRDPAMQQTSVVDMDVRTEMLPHAAAAVALNPATPPARRMIRHSFSSISGPAPYSSMGPVRDHRLAEHGPGPEAEAEAVVELHEESAAAFQDFLFWAYPHLDCRVSWTNVAPVSTCPSTRLSNTQLTPPPGLACSPLVKAAGTGPLGYLLSFPPHPCVWETHRRARPGGRVRARGTVSRSESIRA